MNSDNSWTDRFVAALGIDDASRDSLRRDLERVSGDRRLMEILPQTAARNMCRLSELSGLPLGQVIRRASRTPAVFYNRPDSIMARVEGLARVLGVSQKRFLALSNTSAHLWTVRPETVSAKIAIVMETLDLVPGVFECLCLRQPTLIGMKAETIVARAQGAADALGIALSDAVEVARKCPAVLVRGHGAVEEQVGVLTELFALGLAEAQALIVRMPKLLTSKPETLRSTVDLLAVTLEVDVATAQRMAMRFPPLFYLNPGPVREKMMRAADLLGMEFAAMRDVFVRMPTLATREPVAFARKVRLGMRISRVLGQDVDAAGALAKCPALPTYSTNRLLVRWAMARLGLWTWDWPNLVLRSDAKCIVLLTDYWGTLPEGSAERLRLARMMQRRVGWWGLERPTQGDIGIESSIKARP